MSILTIGPASSTSADTNITEPSLPSYYKAIKLVQWLTGYMVDWRLAEPENSELDSDHASHVIPKAFEPGQALRDYANGAFSVPAVISTEFLKTGVNADPLQGLPSSFTIDGKNVEFYPNITIRRASETYCRIAGIPLRPLRKYAKLDKARSTKIAQLYEDMEATPTNAETQAAYKALCTETLAQWQVIKSTGLHVEYEDEASRPAYPNPRKAILDILHNNHLLVTPTRSAFGNAAFQHDPQNPLLTETCETISGTPALVNDLFRIAHDYFGHSKEGLGFRAEGEENAWRMHAVMYSPLARRAMTTELRGQNSWINFGPCGVRNRKAGMSETVFAVQKLGLLPEWCASEGIEDPSP